MNFFGEDEYDMKFFSDDEGKDQSVHALGLKRGHQLYQQMQAGKKKHSDLEYGLQYNNPPATTPEQKATYRNLARKTMEQAVRPWKQGEALDPTSFDIKMGGDLAVPKFMEKAVVGFGRGAAAMGENVTGWALGAKKLFYDDIAQKQGIDPIQWQAADGSVPVSDYDAHMADVYENYDFYYNKTAAGTSWQGIGGELVFDVAATVLLPLYAGPTNLIKLGSAAAMGAGAAALTTQVPEGESVLPYILAGGALGGALGALFLHAGPMANNLLRGGGKVTGKHLRDLEQLKGVSFGKAADGSPLDLDAFAEKINGELAQYQGKELGEYRRRIKEFAEGIDQKLSPEEQMEQVKRINSLTEDGLYEAADLVDYMSSKADFIDLKKRWMTRAGINELDADLMREAARMAEAPEKIQAAAVNAAFAEKTALRAENAAAKLAKQRARSERGMRQNLGPKTANRQQKRAEENLAWATRKGGQHARFAEHWERAKWDSWDPPSAQKAAEMDEAFTTYAKQEARFAGEATDDEVIAAMDALDMQDGASLSKLSDNAIAKAEAANGAQEVRGRAYRQVGIADIGLLRDISMGGIGMIGGSIYADDPVVGALVGAAAGFGLSKVLKFQKVYLRTKLAQQAKDRKMTPKQTSEFIKTAERARHAHWAWNLSQPRRILKGYGPQGAALARHIDEGRNLAEVQIGSALYRIEEKMLKEGIVGRSRFGKLVDHAKSGRLISDEAADLIVQDNGMLRKYMQNELPNAPVNIRRAGDFLKKEFNDILDHAVKKNLIDADEAAALKLKAKQEGYWPRIYDKDYLSTARGREDFVETLMSKDFTKGSAESVVKSLLGEDHPLVTSFLKSRSKDGTKVYYFDKQMAQRLLKHSTTRAVSSAKSTHLEHGRKLHGVAEEVLNKFTIGDPMKVMTSYLDDVHRRAEYASRFGRKGEVAAKMWDDIGKQFSAQEEDFAREFYLHNIGDPQAAAIKKAINMADEVAEFMGHASAWANLNLMFAQMLNLFQAGVYGTVQATRYVGLRKALRDVGRGFGDLSGRDITLPSGKVIPAQRFAKESAADLETVLMTHLGEMSVMNHTLMGSRATAAWKDSAFRKTPVLGTIVDTLNEPTKFLRAIQFTRIEGIQRRWAALTGVRVAKSLYEEMDELVKKGTWAEGTKDYKRIKSSLEELGLGLDRGAAESQAYHVAALRFSNAINFRNTADLIPLNFQNPYAAPLKRFKTFAFHTHNFLINDQIIEPIQKSARDAGQKVFSKEGIHHLGAANIKGMTAYLGTSALLGTEVYEGRERIKGMLTGKGSDHVDEMTYGERVLTRGLWTLGGLGILMDTIGGSNDFKGVAATLLGPYLGDVGGLGMGLVDDTLQAAGVREGRPDFAGSITKNIPEPFSTGAAKAYQQFTGRDPRKKSRKGGSFTGDYSGW